MYRKITPDDCVIRESSINRIVTAALVVMVGTAAAGANLKPDAAIQITGSSAAGLSLRAELPSMAEIVASQSLAGTSMIFKDDETSVPAVTRWIALPEGSLPSVFLKECSSRRLNSDGTPSGDVFRNELVSQKLWPSQPYSISPVEVYRGVPIAAITFYPLQLNKDGSGVENSRIDVSIQFRSDASAPKATPVRDIPGSRATRLLDEMLINPPARDPGERQSNTIEHILFLRSTAVDSFVIKYVDSLAVWKRQMGYKVSIWAVDLGQCSPAMIRDSIRTNYYSDVDDPISHLILMGGDSARLVPYFPPHPDKGDHYYSLMDDDNDPRSERISDITVGRMYSLSSTEFRSVIKRSILYERQPFVQGGERWFHRALYTAENIAAPGGQFVPSMIQLGRWIWYRWGQMGYEPIDTLYAGGDEQAQQVKVIVRNILSRQGVSIAISRGWLSGCLEDDGEATVTGRGNPFVSAITCLSAPTQAKFFRDTALNTSSGPIASFAIWNLTHSKTNNCLMGGQVRAMYQFGYTQPGLIQNFSKIQLWSDYSIAEESYEEVDALLWAYRLMGDPTVDVFTDTPDTIEADHSATLVTGTTAFNIHVTKNSELLAGAVVCVRQGEMSYVAVPGEDGNARFVFPDGLEGGSLKVTITAHNSIPYINSIPVEVQGSDLILSQYEINGPDQNYRAGDTLTVLASLHNPGQNAVDDVTLILNSESPWVTFLPDSLDLGDVEANSDREAEFRIAVNRSAPDSANPQVNLKLTSGNRSWEESIEFFIAAPKVTLTGMAFGNGDRFDRGRVCRVLPPLRNQGTIASVAVDAELVSHDPEIIIVTGANAQYSAANPGARLNIDEQFSVRLDSSAIPGNIATFDLILTARGGDSFRDTLLVTIPIGQREASDPVGPDDYGYLCFDSFDQTWPKHPTFDWREINPNEGDAEFEGTDLDMDDWREDDDKTTVIDLPFPFTYYGEEFRQIAVCTNGWIAFGADKGIFVDFRNTQIPGVLGPDAQLAVMWDDLIVQADWDRRGVYVHHVENESIFIIEWSKMQVFQDRTATAQEFQLILKDPAHWPTRSGDGEILYQYKTFNAASGNSTDNKYSTIGIKNLDGTDGLQYTYWDEYLEDQGARRIEDRMALLFTTDVELIVGSVSGRATLFEDTSRAMPGVRVTIAGVSSTVTDAEGRFSLIHVPIGQYTVTFTEAGYNQGRVAITVRDGENSVANARLTHPTPQIAQQSVEAWLAPGNERGWWYLDVANDGNGELDFNLALRYPNGVASLIPQRLATHLSPLVEGQSIFSGVEIIGGLIYVTSGGNPNDSADNYIIILNRQGQEEARFHQPSRSGSGFQDLAFDGTYLWGGEDSMVVQFDLRGRARRSIRIPVYHEDGVDDQLRLPRALAWNPENSTLLMANQTSPIYEMNMDGEIDGVHRFTLPRHVPNIFGLGWNSGDIDGMPLYAVIRDAPDGRSVLLAKTNFADSKLVKQLSRYNGEKGIGLGIGFGWETYKTVVATITTNLPEADTLRVFELGPDTRGISYDLGMLHVLPNQSLSVPIWFSSAGMDTGTYRYSLVTFHNALADSIVTPVNFLIRDGAGVLDDDIVPEKLTLDPAYPNPFNGATRLSFALPHAGFAALVIYDIEGREVVRLARGEFAAGRHIAVWDAEKFSSGVYFARLEAAGASLTTRMVLLR